MDIGNKSTRHRPTTIIYKLIADSHSYSASRLIYIESVRSLAHRQWPVTQGAYDKEHVQSSRVLIIGLIAPVTAACDMAACAILHLAFGI